jgi:hypothetical protein
MTDVRDNPTLPSRTCIFNSHLHDLRIHVAPASIRTLLAGACDAILRAMPKTPLDPSKGGKARAAKLSPGERHMIASKSAMVRWYRIGEDQEGRINAVLRLLANAVEEATASGDTDRMVRAISAMGQWERMKMWLSERGHRSAAAATPVNMELEQIGADAARRFEAGKNSDKEEESKE